ncbi:MAG: hypothetical protein QM710_01850 [Flavobacterium sp.]
MTTANNNRTQTNIKLFVAFVLLVLSSTGVFAQDNAKTAAPVAASTEVSVSKDAEIIISAENTVAGMDFAVWFMGTKKTTDTTASNGTFSKKQLINSGINTNSVLIRSFLKKMNTQENGVA